MSVITCESWVWGVQMVKNFCPFPAHIILILAFSWHVFLVLGNSMLVRCCFTTVRHAHGRSPGKDITFIAIHRQGIESIMKAKRWSEMQRKKMRSKSSRQDFCLSLFLAVCFCCQISPGIFPDGEAKAKDSALAERSSCQMTSSKLTLLRSCWWSGSLLVLGGRLPQCKTKWLRVSRHFNNLPHSWRKMAPKNAILREHTYILFWSMLFHVISCNAFHRQNRQALTLCNRLPVLFMGFLSILAACSENKLHK